MKIKKANYKKIAKEFLEEAKKRMREDLISAILFGSVPRGTAKEESDIDILIIAKNLPSDWRKKDALLKDAQLKILKKYCVRVSPVFFNFNEKKEIISPLLYGVLTGYEVLYDPFNYWKESFSKFQLLIKKEKPIYMENNKKWELAKII